MSPIREVCSLWWRSRDEEKNGNEGSFSDVGESSPRCHSTSAHRGRPVALCCMIADSELKRRLQLRSLLHSTVE